jgi:hypothetical protein
MSTFSSSLNNEITQEVQIASLPIQLLQNDVNTLTNQQTELGTLTTDVTNVQSGHRQPGLGGRQYADSERIGWVGFSHFGQHRHGGHLFAPGRQPGHLTATLSATTV